MQINTRNSPAARRWNVGLSLGGNLQTAFAPSLGYRGGRTDFLGIDDGTRAQPRRQPGESDPDFYRRFPNLWSTTTGPGAPNYGLSLSTGGQTQLAGRKLGYLAAASYSADSQTRLEEGDVLSGCRCRAAPALRPNIAYDNGFFADGTRRTSWRSTSSVQWGLLGSLSLQLAPLHRLSLTTLFTQNSDDEARRYQGLQPKQRSRGVVHACALSAAACCLCSLPATRCAEPARRRRAGLERHLCAGGAG